MALYTVQIAAVSVYPEPKSLSYTTSFNGRSKLSMTLRSESGYRPALNAELILNEDGTPIFGGLIDSYYEEGLQRRPGGYLLIKVTAVDYNIYTDRRILSANVTERTLRNFLIDFVMPYLTPAGVTLHGTLPPVASPNIPDYSIDYENLTSVLDNVGLLASYAREMSPAKVLSMYALGTVSAPFNITDGDGYILGDPVVEKLVSPNYSNRIIVRYSNQAVNAYAHFDLSTNLEDGDVVNVGSKNYTAKNSPFSDTDGYFKVGASMSETLDSLERAINLGTGSGTDYAASTTINNSVSAAHISTDLLKAVAKTPGLAGNSIGCTYTPFASSHGGWITEGGGATTTLQFGLDSTLSAVVTVEDVSEQVSPVYVSESVVEAEKITSLDFATELGNAVLTQRKASSTKVIYETHGLGLKPGQIQTIVIGPRNVNASFLLTEINHSAVSSDLLRRKVTAIQGSVYKGHWRDFFKELGSGGSGSGSTSFSGTGGSGGGSVIGRSIYFLGGMSTEWVQSSGPAWIPAMGPSSGVGGIEYRISTTERGTNTATVYVRLRTSDVTCSVMARLWNLTGGVSVGSSSAVTSTTFTTLAFSVLLTTGEAYYRLELLPGLANIDVNGVGYLE